MECKREACEKGLDCRNATVIAAYNRMYRQNSVNCSKDPRDQIPKKHLDQKLAKKS